MEAQEICPAVGIAPLALDGMMLDCARTTNVMNEEEAVVRGFVVKRKQARVIELLGSRRRRRDATATLDHFRDLDARFIVQLPSDEQTPESIARALALRGAGDTCYVISADSDLDGKRMTLVAALDQVVGRRRGTFLSCVPGTLAYLEDEDLRCILWRRPR
jgi:hypothetical protein